MADNNHIESLLQRPDPRTPPSNPPDVNELQQRVGKRRRRRTLIATSLVGGTLTCLLVVVLWRPHFGSDANQNRGGAATVANEPTPLDAPVSLASNEPSGVRVFATVWHQIPIFELEEKTQALRHLGWIDSEEMVPVDLSQFSSDQQKSIEAVLYENDTEEYFNL
jgi:hypothetical protein